MLLMLANTDQRILNWGQPPWSDTGSQPAHTLVEIGEQAAPGLDLRDYRYVAGAFVFDPLPPTVDEEDEAAAAQAKADFRSLPNYATFTPDEAESAVVAAVLGGQSKAELDAEIDALPNSVAGMKTGLKQLAGGVVDLRAVLGKVARMVTYLRVIVVRRQ